MLYIKRIIITLLLIFTYAVNASAANLNPSTLTDEQLNAVMGIVTNFILSDDTSPTPNPSKQELAIEKISNYADNSNDAPIVQDYIDAGVTGVTSSNLSDVNQVIKDTDSTNVNTVTEIQTLVNTIIGVDTTKPTITLLGQTSVTLTVGDTYTDAGATASDDRDGDITANIQTTSNVDTTTAGTYTVTYNVSDAAGNEADSVTRTVVVTQSDTIPVVDDSFTIDLTKVDGYNADDSIEEQYLAVVNYLRSLRIKCNDPSALEGPVGSNLVWNTFLTSASQEHSDDMLTTGQFTHEGSGTQSDVTGQTFTPARASTSFERMIHNGYTYSTAGENIAYRAAYPTLPDDSWVRAMEGWMKSHTGHCSNIMKPNFRDFGMAEARGTKPIVFSDGVTRDADVAYWTQNFGSQ